MKMSLIQYLKKELIEMPFLFKIILLKICGLFILKMKSIIFNTGFLTLKDDIKKFEKLNHSPEYITKY